MTKDRNGSGCYPTNERIAEFEKYIRQINKLNGGYKNVREDFDGGNMAFMPLVFAEYGTHKAYPYKRK